MSRRGWPRGKPRDGEEKPSAGLEEDAERAVENGAADGEPGGDPTEGEFPETVVELNAAPGAEPGPTASTPEAAAGYLDQLQRLQAEFDNYRKRVRREQDDWQRGAQSELIGRLLPVLDDLRRAREHAAPEDEPDAAGLVLILRRFEDLLTKAGLEVQAIEPGAPFDPEEHEALIAVPSTEIPEGGIVQVLEPGYRFRERLLRRGKVACSTGPPQE